LRRIIIIIGFGFGFSFIHCRLSLLRFSATGRCFPSPCPPSRASATAGVSP
jgi:hypothetical protein